jgi:hypothetical protein
MALGRVPDEPCQGSVADGVDVYAVRPEAPPFPRCNRGLHDKVWDYYFTTRPAAAGGGSGVGGGSEDDVRDVAAGGCWRRYGAETEYVGDDGEVYGFRRRFAFHEAGDPGKKTVWRMKEFRLNEAPPALRDRGDGVVFQPSAKGLVIWKVYNEVIPEEEPAVEYYNIDDDDDEETGAVVSRWEMRPPPPLHDGVHHAVATGPGEQLHAVQNFRIEADG